MRLTKLQFHIRQYIREYQCSNEELPYDADVFDHLIDTYPEYRRVSKSALRQNVMEMLRREEKEIKADSSRMEEEDSSHEEEPVKSNSNALNQSLYAHHAKVKPKENAKKTKKRQRAAMEEGKESSSYKEDESATSASKEEEYITTRPTMRYSDFGGIDSVLQEIKELIEYPLMHPELYLHLGIEPPRGILLHGPPGTGKSMLANAIAGENDVKFLSISAPEIVSGMSGESEQKLRNLFDTAIKNAPCIIFMDEIDAVTPKRETISRGMERRIVAQLLTCMDRLSLSNTDGKPVIIIGATNRPDALDSALRRAGRFDREICLGIPNEKAREKILQVLSEKMTIRGEFNFQELAKCTPGFVGADLVSLTKEAGVIAVNRVFHDLFGKKKDATSIETEPQVPPSPVCKDFSHINLENKTIVSNTLRTTEAAFTPSELSGLSIQMSDFLEAIPHVQPSSKREGFATIPNTTWDDIGALQSIREELVLSILYPLRHPEKFEQLGLNMPSGVLLYGPPGCGKTLLAKAIASESTANFISIKGPELLDKYVGESERAVRQVFQRANASSPCVIFFDELDALCPRRDSSDSSNVSQRVVNQLLTEMDGLNARRNVFIVAATNRPDIIDPAMLRPGRLDKLLYVPLPKKEDRYLILKTVSRTAKMDSSICLQEIAEDSRCEGFSGADLNALLREAGIAALREHLHLHKAEMGEKGGWGEKKGKQEDQKICIMKKHFSQAFDAVQPSVSKKDQRIYNQMKHNIKKTRISSEKCQGNDANENDNEKGNAKM